MFHTTIYAVMAAGVLASTHTLPARSITAPAQPAQADDSQSDLRKENDRLRQQVKTLEGDLQAALDRIKELEARLAKVNATPQSPPATAPLPTPMPANPALGPGGLLSTLQADYNSPEAGFAGKDVPMGGPGSDPATRQAWTNHQRALESWIAREQRKVNEVQWVGTIDPATIEQRGRDVAMVVVFTNGGRDFRTPIVVDQGLVERLRAADGAVTQAPIVVNAIASPRLTINPNRAETGPFDNPPLVAPFVEFGYDLKVRVLLPADRAKQATKP